MEQLRLQVRDLNTQNQLFKAENEADRTELKIKAVLYEAQLNNNVKIITQERKQFDAQLAKERDHHEAQLAKEREQYESQSAKEREQYEVLLTNEREVSKSCLQTFTQSICIMNHAFYFCIICIHSPCIFYRCEHRYRYLFSFGSLQTILFVLLDSPYAFYDALNMFRKKMAENHHLQSEVSKLESKITSMNILNTLKLMTWHLLTQERILPLRERMLKLKQRPQKDAIISDE